MKKVVFLLAGIVVGLIAHAQTASNTQKKVGYANLEYIISQLPDMKAVEAEMKSTQAQLQSQIQSRQQQVQKQYQDFSAQAATLADTVRANGQAKLERAFAELQQMQRDAQQTLQNKEKLFMAPLYLKVNKTIQEVAEENGFEIILTDKVGGLDFLLFHSNQFDISNLVLRKFGVTPESKK